MDTKVEVMIRGTKVSLSLLRRVVKLLQGEVILEEEAIKEDPIEGEVQVGVTHILQV